jgi:hypothetical protein
VSILVVSIRRIGVKARLAALYDGLAQINPSRFTTPHPRNPNRPGGHFTR